ncbi:hypothetical protein [Paraburkholderia diazotrophica]|uniref:Uncharacterized protein n=1 Tax=Paraburkholderia diazotrophica TaxID=667676 RepID=A0A1H7EDB9_9BURK|nr:hypothetical protein [Paraburkholderia diazotrophica]SEK11047.1 hypothetical protein SAMN05192539_105029 [Paraburkholderia diazotrophica]
MSFTSSSNMVCATVSAMNAECAIAIAAISAFQATDDKQQQVAIVVVQSVPMLEIPADLEDPLRLT